MKSRPADRRNIVHGSSGFTLVELLVVIGIIGLLMSLLVPALSRARRAAALTQCSSNMRQVAMAVLSYANDQRGALIPCLIDATDDRTFYPDGFWWAAELVRMKYLVAPPLEAVAGKPNGAMPAFDLGIFQCPQAMRATDWNPTAGNGKSYGDFPTDVRNDGWCYVLRTDPRQDGAPAYATGTTYQLNARQTGYKTNYAQGTFNPPFVIYTAKAGSNVDTLNQTVREAIESGNYRRSLSSVRRASSFVLLAESSSYFWMTQSPTVVNGVRHYAPRLAARHGSRSANGTNGMTNVAFFDGHCETIRTEPIDRNDGTGPNVPGGCSGMSAMGSSSGTVFTLHMAQR